LSNFFFASKRFPQKSTFLGFWKLNFSPKKQDLINDFKCIRIVFERTIQLLDLEGFQTKDDREERRISGEGFHFFINFKAVSLQNYGFW
jgi:hypothetical protein